MAGPGVGRRLKRRQTLQLKGPFHAQGLSGRRGGRSADPATQAGRVAQGAQLTLQLLRFAAAWAARESLGAFGYQASHGLGAVGAWSAG